MHTDGHGWILRVWISGSKGIKCVTALEKEAQARSIKHKLSSLYIEHACLCFLCMSAWIYMCTCIDSEHIVCV